MTDELTPGKNPFEGITDCAAHVSHVDDDCEFCHQELEAKAEVQRQMSDEATGLIQKINRMGANIDGAIIAMERLDLLIDNIITDPRQRLHFETAFSARMANQLADVERDIRMQTLKAGPQTPLDMLSQRRERKR